MEVALKAGKLKKRNIAKAAMLDAIIWFWFHQVSYDSLFTQQFGSIPAFGAIGLPLGFLVSAGVLFARWDRIPSAFRITVPTLAAIGSIGLIAVNYFALSGTVFEVVTLIFFSGSCFGCQILRLENLAKSPDVRSLTTTLIGSFLLYYVISFILLILPPMAYSVYIILAPMVLFFGINTPLSPTERVGKISKKTFFLTPNLLVIAFGIAGGFVSTAGGIDSAIILEDLFSSPSPSYLIMLLLYMELGVIVSFGLRFRKAMYFVIVNLAWSIGLMMGGLALKIAPGIPDLLSVGVSATIVASFLLFQSNWLGNPPYNLDAKDTSAEDFAHAKGLSKRETEVVLLLLQGRNLRYIQSTLFISEGTARTHVKRIYSKLEVHSKQELIDLFQEQ